MLSKKNGGSYTVEAPTTESENNEKKGVNKGLIIGLVCLAIFIIIMCVILIIKRSGNPRDKVSEALKNTFENFADGDNKLITAFNMGNIIKEKNYTISIDGSTLVNSQADVAVDMDIAVTQDTIEAAGDVDLGAVLPIGFEVQLNADKLKLHTALLNDYLFEYGYRTDNSESDFNMILEQVAQGALDTEALNTLIMTVYDTVYNTSMENLKSDLVTAVTKEVAGIPFSRASAVRYEIDGAEVSCKGYSMPLKHENIVAIADNLDDVFDKYYSETVGFELIGSYIKDAADTLRVRANSFNDATLTFYIYQNRLAAIKMEGNDQSSEIIFKGGDYRAQNLSILSNGDEYCTIESSMEGSVENMLIVTTDEDFISYSYDTSDGKLVFNTAMSDIESSFEAHVNNDGKVFSFKLDPTDSADTYYAADVTVSQGAELKELSGSSIDLNSASLEDLTNVIIDIYMLSMELGN